jgi:PAS domain S-box-containing protein
MRTPVDVAPVEADPSGPHPLDVVEAVNTLAVGVALLSPDLRIVSCNDALIAAFGLRRGDYVGRMFWELLPGAASAPEAEMILNTARDGSTRSCCSQIDELALEIRATQLMSGFVAIEVSDSTVQARLERRFDHLLASMGDGVCVIDAGKRLRYWNAAAERMTGLQSEDIVGRHISVAFGHMGGSQLASRFLESLRQNSPGELRSWSYEGDSSGRAAGIYDAFIFPVEGSGALVIFREVGERVRQERELVDRRTEAEALHAVVRSIAAVTDSAELRQLLAHAAMERCDARGSVVVEVQGSEGAITAAAGDSQPLVGTRIPMAGSLTERAIRAGQVTAIANYSAEFPDHQRHLMGELMGPVLAVPLGAHDRTLGALMVSRTPGAQPFSARSQERLRVMADHAALGLWKLHLLDEAQAANLAKSDFMATMSHELRTPLAALAGYGEILSEQVAGPLSAEQKDVVERMRSVTNHLAALIDEILTYSSLDSGRESVQLTHVVLADVVRESIVVAEPLASQKGISLDYHVPDSIRVCTDPDKLRQILVHLLGNAIKFTERGFVHFNTRTEGSWIHLSIEDSGIGIADEDRQRLFQPFSQLDAGLRRRHRGAGLGLFISQRLAGLIGGSIDYRSALGQGSSFTLRIPALE